MRTTLRLHAALVGALLPFVLSACMIDPSLLNTQGVSHPEPITRTVGTNDSVDNILMSSTVSGPAELVTICLNQPRGDGWWKGLGVNSNEPTLEFEGSNTQCQQVAAGAVQIAFWKAKAFGVHTAVGSQAFDLSEYGGHQITFAWLAD